MTAKPPKQRSASKTTAKRGGKKVFTAEARAKQADTKDRRVEAFVREYIRDLNGTQAAMRAGYTPNSASKTASLLLAREEIKARIEAAIAERAERTQITADKVLEELAGIAFADTNELIEHRLICCRYCYGEGHRYQRTQAELEQDRAAHAALTKEAEAASKAPPAPFDEAGGIGYNGTLPPNPECPECWGQGVPRPVFKDTRLASAGARSLYAGVKVTKDGLEVKVHSKDKALELIGRHLAMWTDKIKHQGDADNPIQMLLKQIGGKSAFPVVDDPSDTTPEDMQP